MPEDPSLNIDYQSLSENIGQNSMNAQEESESKN